MKHSKLPPPRKLPGKLPPPRPTPPALIELEVGMVFEMNGVEHVCTVSENGSAVIRANRGARIRLAGNQTTPRRILRKLDAEGIEDFLSRASGRDEEQKTNITGDNQETKHTMRTKDKAKKTNEASGDKALKLPSKVGRTARVDYLVSKTKKTDSEILKIIQDEFPGGSPKQVSGIIAGKRGKTSNDKPAQKAVKTTRTAKAVKKPAKKVAANARPVRKTKPAPSVPPPRPPAPPVEEQAGLELK